MKKKILALFLSVQLLSSAMTPSLYAIEDAVDLNHANSVEVEEEQLYDSDISLKELNILKMEIKSYLAQIYHSRVAYPKRKDKK